MSWRDRLARTDGTDAGEGRVIGTFGASDIDSFLAVKASASTPSLRLDDDLLCSKGVEAKSAKSADSSAARAAAADAFQERAAIVEYDAGVPRAWAEGLARLDSMAPPLGIHAHRWQRLVDNAGQFIDRWAAKAAALGWDTPSRVRVPSGRPQQAL
jgi:hypothetical protein